MGWCYIMTPAYLVTCGSTCFKASRPDGIYCEHPNKTSGGTCRFLPPFFPQPYFLFLLHQQLLELKHNPFLVNYCTLCLERFGAGGNLKSLHDGERFSMWDIWDTPLVWIKASQASRPKFPAIFCQAQFASLHWISQRTTWALPPSKAWWWPCSCDFFILEIISFLEVLITATKNFTCTNLYVYIYNIFIDHRKSDLIQF